VLKVPSADDPAVDDAVAFLEEGTGNDDTAVADEDEETEPGDTSAVEAEGGVRMGERRWNEDLRPPPPGTKTSDGSMRGTRARNAPPVAPTPAPLPPSLSPAERVAENAATPPAAVPVDDWLPTEYSVLGCTGTAPLAEGPPPAL
jgi:hypothetical protein